MGDDRPRIEKGVLCKRTRKLAIEEIKQNLPLPKILKVKILKGRTESQGQNSVQ